MLRTALTDIVNLSSFHNDYGRSTPIPASLTERKSPKHIDNVWTTRKSDLQRAHLLPQEIQTLPVHKVTSRGKQGAGEERKEEGFLFSNKIGYNAVVQ